MNVSEDVSTPLNMTVWGALTASVLLNMPVEWLKFCSACCYTSPMKLVLIPHKDTVSLLERAGLAAGLLLQPLFCTLADLGDFSCGPEGAEADAHSLHRLLDELKEALRGTDTAISISRPEPEDSGKSSGTVAVCKVDFGFAGKISSVLADSAYETAEVCAVPEIPIALFCSALPGDDKVFPLVSKVFRLGLMEETGTGWRLLDSVWIKPSQYAKSPKAF